MVEISHQTNNGDILKSAYMMTEVLFSLGSDKAQKNVLDKCLNNLYVVVDK